MNSAVVDNAINVDGIRTANPATLDETYELLRERHGMAWIGLYRPPRWRSDQLWPPNDEIKRLTQISLDQNEQVKRISAWAAIRFAPTLVGTIYGMNFMHMPELGWILGYPLALLAMAALGGVLYLIFKRHGWL